MEHNHSIRRYRNWYAKLLRFYPRSHRDRFGGEMEQTFSDLLRERATAGKGLFGCVLWMFADTTKGILKHNVNYFIMRNTNILSIALAVASILMVVLLAMFITDEVNWSVGDFIAAGVLLFGTGLGYDLLARKGGSVAYRAGAGLALGAGLLLVWMNLAVGLIGAENNPANLMYGGVLAVGLLGAVMARFRPHGMARTLFAMGVAQILVAVIALVGKFGGPGNGPGELLILNGFFVALFAGAGLLFRRATLQPTLNA